MCEPQQFGSDQEAAVWLADQSPGPRVRQADTARQRLLDFALTAFKECPNPLVEAHAGKLVDAVEEAARKAAEADRDRLAAEVSASDDMARRCLEQRQEMAAERYVWQERGDLAEARVARVREYVATSDDDGVRTRETILGIVGELPDRALDGTGEA